MLGVDRTSACSTPGEEQGGALHRSVLHVESEVHVRRRLGEHGR
jgi:hypothetical protein